MNQLAVPNASRMKVTRPLNTFPARAAAVCMNRYTRRLDPANCSWIARRLASARLSWTELAISQTSTRRRFVHRASLLSPGSRLVSHYTFRFMRILRNENNQCYFATWKEKTALHLCTQTVAGFCRANINSQRIAACSTFSDSFSDVKNI